MCVGASVEKGVISIVYKPRERIAVQLLTLSVAVHTEVASENTKVPPSSRELEHRGCGPWLLPWEGPHGGS